MENSKNNITKPKVTVDVSDQTKKEQLISNLNKYCIKHKLMLPVGIITVKNLLEYEAGEHGQAKCLFSCPFCDKRVPLTYELHWKSANVTTHLKRHIQNENITFETIENIVVDLE